MPKTEDARKTAKAKALVKALKKHNLNLSETAKEFGVTPQAIRDQVVRNPIVRNSLAEFYKTLDNAGATDQKTARVIAEGMDAEKEVFDKQGKLVKKSEDHGVRLKSTELLLKLKKYIGDTEVGSTTNVGEMKVIIVNGTGATSTPLRRSLSESTGNPSGSDEVQGTELR